MDREQSEISYWIAPQLWNAGLATVAVRALITANPHNARQIFAEVFQDNPGLGHGCSTNCGFEYLGDAEAFLDGAAGDGADMDLRARGSMTLRTERLLLRPVGSEDAMAITDGLRDWEVTRWLSSVPWPYRRQDADWFIAEAEAGRVGAACDHTGQRASRGHRHRRGTRLLARASPLETRLHARGPAAAVVDAFFTDGGDDLASSYLVGEWTLRAAVV